MNFRFFEDMDAATADTFLADYLRFGASALELLAAATSTREDLSFTPSSMPTIFRGVARSAGTVPLEADVTLPDWIVESPEYKEGLYEFDQATQEVLLALSYYLGETVRRVAATRLRWSTGDDDTAVQRQPVVDGFTAGVQLAPILVTENLVRRLIEEEDPTAEDDINDAMASWVAMIE